MYQDVIQFIKHPSYTEDGNTQFNYRLRFLFKITLLALAMSIVISMFTGILQLVLGLDLGEHALDDLFENYSAWSILFLAIILAPFLEELIFRGPISWFRNSRYFKLVFYFWAVLFGYIHISNFEFSTQVLLMSPLLVAPQISVGLLLGTIRIKFGLIWSMAMHCLYNLILVGPIVILKMLNIPLE
jgi:membrane protease YdiL (CAAX protease family)